MDEIKSALEIAMEKVAEIGEPTEEERLKWKYAPLGEQVAGRYFSKHLNMTAEINKYQADARKFVILGAYGILIRNISLPANENTAKNNKRAMEGLKELKNDKVALENVLSKIRHLFSHYAGEGNQQKKQAYDTLKANFTARVQQAAQQQLGTDMGSRIDVERMPQFQQEWSKVNNQLDAQYLKLLDEYKQELAGIE